MRIKHSKLESGISGLSYMAPENEREMLDELQRETDASKSDMLRRQGHEFSPNKAYDFA